MVANIKIKFPTLEGIAKRNGEVIKKPIFKRLAKIIPERIIENLNKGQSSIKGKGRLVPYKFPEKYPGTGKAHTPVDFKGFKRSRKATEEKYHKAIRAEISGGVLEIGVFGDKNVEKFEGLTAGDTRGRGKGGRLAGPRPHIPVKRREEFTDKIQQEIVDVVVEEIAKFVKKTSK